LAKLGAGSRPETRMLEGVMRITGWAGLAAALLLGLAACAPATTTSASKAWPEFRAPGADFTVLLPEAPVTGKDSTAKDGTVSRSYHVDRGAIVYFVAYTTSMPPKKPAPLDGWLDNIRNELVAKMKGKLHDERRLAMGDARGMELALDIPKDDEEGTYTIRGRYYVRHVGSGKDRKDVLYQTFVIGEPGHDSDATVTRFLDSFRFVAG
jgi:hypothetical protein